MEYDFSLYYYLKDFVRVIYLTGNKDHTIVRCPICGDSLKDSRKARFYILNQAPFPFYCFNCDSYGYVNDKILDALTDGSYDLDFLREIKSKQREYKSVKNRVTSKIYDNKYFKREITFSHNKKYINKLGYLEKRLKVKLDHDDIERFKIVISLKDFFKDNGLDIDKRLKDDKEEFIFKNLDRNYIGFLSADKNIIIFRNTDSKEEKYRFNNYPIFNNKYIDSRKTYTISSKLNLMQEKPTVRIAEGPIDIISVYLNVLNDKERENDIFIGNGGKGYASSADYLTSLGMLSVDYHVYSDKDVDLRFFRNIKKNNPSLNLNPMHVYYNDLYKDFGVKKSLIQLGRGIQI